MTVLSIIILSYNTKDLTVRCIESIIKQYKKELERGEFEIVVVDNNSKDGTIQAIQSSKFNPSTSSGLTLSGVERVKVQSYSPKLKVIENDKNYGFAKGCNIGARAAKGEYLLFLNSDTEVQDKGFLKMVDFLEDNTKIGILGGKLLNPNGSPQPSACKFYTMLNFLLLLIGGERFGWLRSSPTQISRADWVSGGCFMTSRKLFGKLKGFDEHFFMYMEDMELCFRAKLLGFPTYFFPNVKVVHQSLGSSTREFAIKNIDKGILYFYKKHKSYWQYLLVEALLTVKGVVRACLKSRV